MDEKLNPLKEVGIIVRCHTRDYASDVVVAAKKDADTGRVD
jgi:hypothetical protein